MQVKRPLSRDRSLLRPLILAWMLSLPVPGFSQGEVPISSQAKLLLKVLSYDTNLAERSGGGIHIAVIHKEGVDASTIVSAFLSAGKDKVAGLSVSAQAVPFISVQKLLEIVDKHSFNTLYVHPSTIAALSSIQQVARGKKIVSIGGSKALVEQGVSLGVYMKKDVPRLVVNERSAKVEGLDLKPAIRLISTIIK